MTCGFSIFNFVFFQEIVRFLVLQTFAISRNRRIFDKILDFDYILTAVCQFSKNIRFVDNPLHIAADSFHQ